MSVDLLKLVGGRKLFHFFGVDLMFRGGTSRPRASHSLAPPFSLGIRLPILENCRLEASRQGAQTRTYTPITFHLLFLSLLP